MTGPDTRLSLIPALDRIVASGHGPGTIIYPDGSRFVAPFKRAFHLRARILRRAYQAGDTMPAILHGYRFDNPED